MRARFHGNRGRETRPPRLRPTRVDPSCCAMPRSFLRSLAGFYNDNDDGIASHRLTQPGGVHRSDRSDVGCTHAQACPLFPLLNESLRGWRDYYCDSDDRWCECARYKLAVTGQLVPISLLPNGKDAQHLRRAADADQSDVAEP